MRRPGPACRRRQRYSRDAATARLHTAIGHGPPVAPAGQKLDRRRLDLRPGRPCRTGNARPSAPVAARSASRCRTRVAQDQAAHRIPCRAPSSAGLQALQPAFLRPAPARQAPAGQGPRIRSMQRIQGLRIAHGLALQLGADLWPVTPGKCARGSGPPVAQSSSSTVCTTGTPVPEPICIMQPMLPAAMHLGPLRLQRLRPCGAFNWPEISGCNRL